MNKTEYLAKQIKLAHEAGFAWFTWRGRRLKIEPMQEIDRFSHGTVLIRNRGKIDVVNYTTKDAYPRLRAGKGFHFGQDQIMAVVTECHNKSKEGS